MKKKKTTKQTFIQVRVTQGQKELFQRAAAEAGITLSAWVVERLLQKAKQELRQQEG